ncbi:MULTISPECIES: SAM-dependent methyltransferase [unclassified Nocardiopsis]|uniref:SAM-dependent methyltransferase n=1 Tax=unclassified Nocardiopsis TaxID=2649073 RepID=UPI00135807F1|nr:MULTISPECIES: SAM-dependent methyltransferase [unclassified Nocardiopsis]
MADTPIDTSVAHTARVWNYWLGGTDNYPADREVGDAIRELMPQIVEVARGDRGFLRRVVTHLVREEGVRQFLDIGAGLPTAGNTHEVARAHAPEARVVYVDNDPSVLAHARRLLGDTDGGRTRFVGADLRDTGAVLSSARRTLDLDRPVALTLLGTLGHIGDAEEAMGVVRAYMDALAPGSFLAVCDGVYADMEDIADERTARALRHWREAVAQPYHMRSVGEFGRFFDGLELAEPGIVSVTRWRPEPDDAVPLVDVPQYCGLARKL